MNLAVIIDTRNSSNAAEHPRSVPAAHLLEVIGNEILRGMNANGDLLAALHPIEPLGALHNVRDRGERCARQVAIPPYGRQVATALGVWEHVLVRNPQDA